MNAEDMPIANKDSLNQEDCSKQENKGDSYSQNGNHGIGHMSGGEIKDGAKVAGVNNEKNNNQYQKIDAQQVTVNNNPPNTSNQKTIKITRTKTHKIGEQEKSETVSIEFPVSVVTVDLKKFLEDIAGSSIEFEDAEPGSIKFILSGSEEGLNNIAKSFNSGELAPLVKQQFNLEVEDVRLIDFDSSERYQTNKNQKLLAFTIAGDVSQADIDILKAALIDTSDNDEEIKAEEKSRLVKEIRTQGAAKRNLSGADLRGADLRGADLRGANLSKADLSEVKLNGANLNGANLIVTQALATDFKGASLTGACIQDWNINSKTNLDNVICDYVYLKENQQERRPHDPNKNFAPGEFSKLFQKALETVDLIFKDGIDWKAFLLSFQELRDEYGEENLSIQAIEKKSGGTFVIRLEVPPEADKGVVESHAKELYETKQQALEAKYRAELQAKDKEIKIYKQHNTDILELAKLAASRPIIVEAKAVAESESKANTYNQSGNFGIGHMSGGEIKDNAKVAGVINETSQQNLAETVAEIQALIQQLEQSHPTNTTTEQMEVATQAIAQIESNPTRKQKAIAAFKQGSLKALETHPVGAFIVGAIKGWQKLQAE